jgi:hypothetical protein
MRMVELAHKIDDETATIKEINELADIIIKTWDSENTADAKRKRAIQRMKTEGKW